MRATGLNNCIAEIGVGGRVVKLNCEFGVDGASKGRDRGGNIDNCGIGLGDTDDGVGGHSGIFSRAGKDDDESAKADIRWAIGRGRGLLA